MKKILVATDLSARADRALRRAVLLAKRHGGTLSLVHVVDDDQPQALLDAAQRAAWDLLQDQARALHTVDGLDCEPLVVMGDPFAGILAAADRMQPDLLVVGPHRRQALRDIFVGTTAERAIRGSRLPVLMANGLPAAAYRHVLVATDFSEGSAAALRAVAALGLDEAAEISVLHVHDTLGSSGIARSAMTAEQAALLLATEESKARLALGAFLQRQDFQPAKRLVIAVRNTVPDAIHATASGIPADLVVIGTSGRSRIARLLLGSVSEAVLRAAEQDVLAVPPDGRR